ncbi:hypothetical protein [Robertkochia aurantiaca]|uniref:hypothetical protein n=1 Tax=Robertkochia aurantiaca TaxID=2873700 RepID=UPI001CCACABE|nr:hypothetical protein [Robertkochia sp. 3YJGBD-33]
MKEENKNFKAQTLRNTKNLSYWTMAWVATMAVASFGPEFIWDYDKVYSGIAIGLNIAVGIGMILANRKFLLGLDELQRKIHMDAMAIALGVAVVGGLSYSLLDVTNIISADAEISGLVILIGLTYLVSVVINSKRYS